MSTINKIIPVFYSLGIEWEEFLVQELRHDQSNKSHWHAQNSKPEIRLWISLKHLTFDAGFITMVDSIFPRLLNVSFFYNSNFFHSKTNKITNSAILGRFCFALGSSNLWRRSFNLRIKKSRQFSCFLRRPQKLTKSSLSIWHLLHNVKSTVKISSIFVAFLEDMNFKILQKILGTKYLVHWPDHVVGVKLSPEILLKNS